MAFTPENLNVVVQTIGGVGPRWFFYQTDDTDTIVLGDGYFERVAQHAMKANDLITVIPRNGNYEPYTVVVQEVTNDGRATAILPEIPMSARLVADLDTLVADTTPKYPVGTTFLTRAESFSFEVVSSDPDLTTAGGVKLRATGEVLSPYQFGYTRGMSDCTTIIQRMFTRGRAFRFDPTETYKISAQIDTGSGAHKVIYGGRVRFEVNASLGASACINLRDITAERIEIHIASGYTCLVACIVRNGYSNIRELYVTSDDLQTGYSGSSQSAIRFDCTDGNRCAPKIGTLYVRNFDRAAWFDTSISEIEIDWVDIRGCYRGIQSSMVDVIRLHGGIIHADSPNKSTAAGNNAFVLHGNHIQLGTFWGYDCGEHMFRFIAGNVGAGTTGGNISFQHLNAIRPGRCGVKFSSGTPSAETDTSFINKISGDAIYVEDAGHANDPAPDATQYGDDGIGTPWDNDFGLNIQRCRDVRIGSFINKKRENNWAGRYGMKLESVRDLNIDHIHIEDTFDAAIWVRDNFGDPNVTGDTNLERWNMPDVYIRNCNNGGSSLTPAIRFTSIVETARWLFMQGVVLDCPGILDVTVSGSGSIAQPCFFSFRHRGITGDLYVSVGATNIFRDFQPLSARTAGVYTGGTASNLEYPIGTTLIAKVTGTEPARNGAINPYQHTSENCWTTSSTSSTGSQLTGTWRSRGVYPSGADKYCLIERTE